MLIFLEAIMEITIAGKVFPFIKMRQGSYFDKETDTSLFHHISIHNYLYKKIMQKTPFRKQILLS